MIVRKTSQCSKWYLWAFLLSHLLVGAFGWTSLHWHWPLHQTRLWNSLPSPKDDDAVSPDYDSLDHRRTVPRRQFIWSSLIAPLAASTFSNTASARGLVQFPCKVPLANSYHLLRVGTTLLEEEGIWSTNPLFLTNRDDALSPSGVEQVVAACRLMQQDESLLPTLVKYSLAASCIDTATIVGQELKLGTDRLVPEFTFLDPRAIGNWDMSARNVTLPAVWAMDNDEAGRDGVQGRPPASDDGTPHEVLADQAVRLRQVLSILESQYSGDTILLIFPDGTGPALLSAMIAGIPYNRAHEINFQPGEIRFDVTMESTLALWKSKQLTEGEFYKETLREGRVALKELRATQMSGGTVTNLKDQRLEEERIAIETEYRRKERRRLEEERKDHEQRLRRQREIAVHNGNSSGLELAPPVAAASVLAAGAALWSFRSSGELNVNDTKVVPLSDIDDKTTVNLEMSGTSSLEEASLSKNAPNASVNMTFASSPVLDPTEKARIAMEEYMNRDDGADDWILSLTQIIEEDVDKEIAENNVIFSTLPSRQSKNGTVGNGNELQNLTRQGELLSRAIGDEVTLKASDLVFSPENEEAFQ